VKPLNLVTSGISLTAATLDWDAVSGAWGYRVRYKQVSQGWGAWTYDTITTNTHALSNLLQGTVYHWQVLSMCDANGSNNSGFVWPLQTFQTLSSNRITAGDIQLGKNLNIYPNPTRGLFNISFIAEKVDNFEITIVDAFGKLVSQEDKQDFIGVYNKQVDLSDSPRGIYMLQLKTQNSLVSKRIVLQ